MIVEGGDPTRFINIPFILRISAYTAAVRSIFTLHAMYSQA